MRNETVKWMVLAACGLALPALAGEALTWTLPGWDPKESPVVVDVADDGLTVTVYLADPPDPDRDLTGDPPTEADPPQPDLDMIVVIDTASIESLRLVDAEGRSLGLVYVGDPFVGDPFVGDPFVGDPFVGDPFRR